MWLINVLCKIISLVHRIFFFDYEFTTDLIRLKSNFSFEHISNLKWIYIYLLNSSYCYCYHLLPEFNQSLKPDNYVGLEISRQNEKIHFQRNKIREIEVTSASWWPYGLKNSWIHTGKLRFDLILYDMFTTALFSIVLAHDISILAHTALA